MEGNAMPHYTAIVTMVAVLLYFYDATRVSIARRRFGVELPATSGHPDFERVIHVHMNMLEWMPIFLPLLWLCALYLSDGTAAVIGLAWIMGRGLYLIGYADAVERRLPGFFLQAMACMLLLIGAIAGMLKRFA
jgi:glutathione S-transferase